MSLQVELFLIVYFLAMTHFLIQTLKSSKMCVLNGHYMIITWLIWSQTNIYSLDLIDILLSMQGQKDIGHHWLDPLMGV